MPPAGGEWAVVERAGEALRFRPAGGDRATSTKGPSADEVREVTDRRGGRWILDGQAAALAATVDNDRFDSPDYPDALSRLWSALTAPHAGDFIVSLTEGFEAVDWGGISHAGGGSHGSLLAGDSLGPLLFVGCGPDSPDARDQWTLRDVAPVVREHFGLNEREG
jgi:hypothetical protein